jgi:hypothetical protein
MKKLLLILLAHTSCHSTLFAQCEPSTFVFSPSPGVTQSGAYLALEGGIWPIDGKLGVMAGALMYDEKVTHDKGTEKLTQMDLSGRVIYKLTKVGSSCPQLITAFATVRGLLGASYRAYWSIGETQLLGVEPMYVNRLGVGVNILFTTRL